MKSVVVADLAIASRFVVVAAPKPTVDPPIISTSPAVTACLELLLFKQPLFTLNVLPPSKNSL